MSVSRQDSQTEIPELVGTRCEEFCGVGRSLKDGLGVFYICLSRTSYRFFIDVGVLFWSESPKDPEDDLLEGESYIDLLPSFGIQPLSKVTKIEMKEGKLLIQLNEKN
ncbi:hypothetical protein [Kiloniella sp.]|uniref:hypothetical protein n=1 Tax=Kiloniella sp. TaxID=1938587 RepID=UPI003B01E4D4